MIDGVATFIKKRKLVERSDKVLVAVSGGVDSMVLIHVLRALDYDVSVAHMNFQLRGDASDKDESFVRDWCISRNVGFISKEVDTYSEKKAGGLSTQMAARKLRYDWFDELCQNSGFNKIATAHHLNDSLETMILNLVKGTSVKGLAGIPTINDKVIRPLLNISKEEILKYARDERIVWREDLTNADSKYQRNMVRNEVVRLLERINPSLIETFKSTRERMIGADEIVENMVAQLREEHLSESEDELRLSWFKGSSGHLLLLSELLRSYGVSYSLACEIGQEHSSGKIFLTLTHKIVYDRHRLLFQKIDHRSNEPLEISKPNRSYTWGDWKITINSVNSDNIEFRNEKTGYFDEGRIHFPVKVRSQKEGDSFVPLGMNGKKKVSDFMIDAKIPLTQKDDIPIFESKADIFWVGGHRMDDRFKVQKTSKRVIKIEVEKCGG